TGVGYASLQNVQTTAASNTALGYNTGATLTTGGSNILIGAGADVPIATSSSRLNIGNTIYGDLATDQISIGSATITEGAGLDLNALTAANNSSLRLPVSTTALRPTTGATGMMRYNSTTNLFEFYQNGAWVNYTSVSDARLKTDVQPVKGALDKVAALQPITFKWDTKNPRAAGLDDGKRHVGFLAQDLEKILPEVVNTGADSYRSVEYGQIVAVAVGAIKELKSENETLWQEMKSLRETSGGKDQNPAQAVSDKTLLLVAYVGGGLGLILLGGMAGLGLMLVRTRREVRRLGGLS
ncbi:MAG: tail fiber domain-containing protein, partial [Alphaproteobacteria bacterium]|nr:tail fiber domain-containing protein [Alphaproteobacteria bacterium]